MTPGIPKFHDLSGGTPSFQVFLLPDRLEHRHKVRKKIHTKQQAQQCASKCVSLTQKKASCQACLALPWCSPAQDVPAASDLGAYHGVGTWYSTWVEEPPLINGCTYTHDPDKTLENWMKRSMPQCGNKALLSEHPCHQLPCRQLQTGPWPKLKVRQEAALDTL